MNRIHGKAGTKVYLCWQDMIKRCTKSNHEYYYLYGARGITVCDKWFRFEGFYEDMGDPPNGTTLDRIDGSKGYSKDNCRWATPAQQTRNQIRNVWLEFHGKKMILKDWAVLLGLHPSTLSKRHSQGLPVGLVLWPTRLPTLQKRKAK